MVYTAERAALKLLRNTGQQGEREEKIRKEGRPKEGWRSNYLLVIALNMFKNKNLNTLILMP